MATDSSSTDTAGTRPVKAVGTDNPWLVMALAVLLSAAALYPVFSVDIPPLADYPNHLARAHIIASIDASPELRSNYQVNWPLSPYLAMDWIVSSLAGIMPVYEAGRLFVALTLVTIVAGALAVHLALFKRLSPWPLFVHLFLFNHLLAWGFLNFLFAVGLSLLALAAWIATTRWPMWLRAILFTAASVAIFFTHVFALGIYALTIAGLELGRAWRARREKTPPIIVRDLVGGAAQFVAPIVLWLMAPMSMGDSAFRSGSLMRALVTPVIMYEEPLDGLIFAFVGFVLILGFWSRALRLAPPVGVPLAILAVTAVVLTLSPIGFWAEWRIPLALCLLLVAGTEFRPRGGKSALIVLCGALVLYGARVVTTAETWQRYDRHYAELRLASATIAKGARLLPVFHSQPFRMDRDVSTGSMSLITIIERSVFVPMLFTDPALLPVQAAARNRFLDVPGVGHPHTEVASLLEGADPEREAEPSLRDARGGSVYWANWPEHFDYVLITHFSTGENPLPEHLEKVHEGSFFDIYKVIR